MKVNVKNYRKNGVFVYHFPKMVMNILKVVI